MKKLFNNPYKERPHSMNGIQKLYKFPNGYGASIVRFTLDFPAFDKVAPNGNEYGSYTSNENEWELAVIKWDEDDFKLDYDNPVADGDVLGYLTEDMVEEKLKEIKNL